MSERPPVRRVMISSTALDLPEHRRQASDACLRMSMLPVAMEQMPASPDDALKVSREYVDKADFYLGIFGLRYGFVPEGQEKSITELEYDRAIERQIPVFIFIAHDRHTLVASDIETGAGAPKLQALKERLRKAHVVGTFRSPDDLRAEIISALSAYRQDDVEKLHYVAEIPSPPTPWVAHWYSLLNNRPLVGRRAELNLLTDWVTNPSSEMFGARLLALVAIGGIGKSALAWTWFNEIAPNEMKPLAGRMWWSFYESDARLENFTARALAYLTGKPRTDTEQIPARDREDQLIAILDREPHLVVLDGMERELVAYARMDAAHLADEGLDANTAHRIARRAGLPASAAQSFVGEPKLRQTADPRTGHFLRRLTRVNAARILVTTRLFPFELQDFNGEPVPGTSMLSLRGLSDDDAVALWRAAGISGARDALVPLFRSFEGHPLLVRALAGEIARDRRSPGDFEKWRERHPHFNPFALPMIQRKAHVLEYSLHGLRREQLALLRTIAGFRMPAAYETLAALLVGDGHDSRPLVARVFGKRRPRFPNEEAFDRALADLGERGLVGWDRRANRYDLHPIVRGVVWSGISVGDRQVIAERMRAHFAPMSDDVSAILERREDVTPAIELYVSLVRLGRFSEAFGILRWRMPPHSLRGLSNSRQYLELVELLFPDGVDYPPRLDHLIHESLAIYHLGVGYEFCGEPGRAIEYYRRAVVGREREGTWLTALPLLKLSKALLTTGNLHAAFASAYRAFKDTVAMDLGWRVIVRDIRFLEAICGPGCRSFASAMSDAAPSLTGEIGAIAIAKIEDADERLHQVLTRARAVYHAQEELAALTELAALWHRRGDTARSREYLDAVWDAAERGPYRLLHADARNVLAGIEIADKNIPAAIAAATAAYRLAWCDGPPFAYDYGLRTARARLAALGAPEPELPPYDASKHEPIEEIDFGEIDIEPDGEQAQ